MKTRFVLISGTSTGIGNASAKFLASNGYKVIAGVRKESDFAQLSHPNITPILLDVSSEESMQAAIVKTKELSTNHGLYALINNAGFNYVSPLETNEMTKLRTMMEVNYFGLVRLSQLALPLLQARFNDTKERSKLINISSIGGAIGLPFESAYHASKFAVLGTSQGWRIELAPLGVDVTAILPGLIKTNFLERSKEDKGGIFSKKGSLNEAYYKKSVDNFVEMGDKMYKSGSESEDVAKAILTQLNAYKSTSRVLVGNDAKFLYFITKLLPATWVEKMIAGQMVKV